jgi:hypothetical protein
MILSDKIEIKVSRRNINKIKKILNNDKIKIDDIVFISPGDLTNGSHFKIKNT